MAGPVGGICQTTDKQHDDYLQQTNQALAMGQDHWRQARSAQEKRRLAGELYEAAIHAGRPDIAEEAVAGSPLKFRQIAGPHHSRRVPLRTVHAFEEVESRTNDECEEAPNQGNGWLARRITRDALEVWTPTHGWLFDGKGRLLNEARPVRDGGSTGREWYGAFLPDGRWVTTDLHPADSSLSFFSREGQLLKTLSCEELAPRGPYTNGSALLGWARSDKKGTGWVVNVGSEEGYATILVGPEGPARRLLGAERWQSCYPRALGARGWYISMWVPDDGYHVLLQRNAAGHGPNVGYPGYREFVPKPDAAPDALDDESGGDGQSRVGLDHPPTKDFLSVPNGNALFGFWPQSREVFIGSRRPSSGPRQTSRSAISAPERDENATWFFNARGEFRGWLRGRRLADAADGRGMLFRLEGSQEVMTLRPNLHATQTRRFVWADGKIATALSLFDDLHLGLFRTDDKLVLGAWQ